jgi:hypothetical protein
MDLNVRQVEGSKDRGVKEQIWGKSEVEAPGLGVG